MPKMRCLAAVKLSAREARRAFAPRPKCRPKTPSSSSTTAGALHDRCCCTWHDRLPLGLRARLPFSPPQRLRSTSAHPPSHCSASFHPPQVRARGRPRERRRAAAAACPSRARRIGQLDTAREAKPVFPAAARRGAFFGPPRPRPQRAAHAPPPARSHHPPTPQVTTASFAELLKCRTRPQRYGPADIFSQPVTEQQVVGFKVAQGHKAH